MFPSVQEPDEVKEIERKRVIRQINPHFIFNALAAIRVMTKIDANMAYDLIYDFSKYMKTVFQSLTYWENIPIKEEIVNVISYTNLEKVKFGNDITICLDIEETDFVIPPLSVQPLVENAIVHGLKKGGRKGTVWIRSRETSSEYLVQIEDDGIGFDIAAYRRRLIEESLKYGGLQRVKYQMERQISGGVEIKSIVGQGTVVTLHIPKIPKQNNRRGGDGHEHKSYIGR